MTPHIRIEFLKLIEATGIIDKVVDVLDADVETLWVSEATSPEVNAVRIVRCWGCAFFINTRAAHETDTEVTASKGLLFTQDMQPLIMHLHTNDELLVLPNNGA